ncbi:AAA family ATPase [Endozoicomonas sp. 4G]|uniref:AAA family ATPase n=1 Tax=Endozoicomonas sp. 4G TaxID=2872754 RepID=UPI00207887B8|nr:AAA family ATPase [Endozoicomonas sp. 4G]
MHTVFPLSDVFGQHKHFLTTPRNSKPATDPTGYLQEKQLNLELLRQLIGLRVTKDRWYGDCIEYPLTNTQGQLCGYERIYARGVLHKRCPDRFSEKDNKKVTRDTRTATCFAPVGIAVDELSQYSGTLRIVGGMADAVSVFLATNEPVISIVGENNAPAIVTLLTKQWPHLKNQMVVALDHDLPGIFACQRTGLQWIVPVQYGDDWSDVRQQHGIEAVKQQLSQPLRQHIRPVEPEKVLIQPHCIEAIRYQNYQRAIGTLKNVSDTDPAQAAGVALKLIQRFHKQVPAKLSEQQFMETIAMTCRFCLHPDTLKALAHKLYGFRQQDLDVVRQSDSFSAKLIKALGKHYHPISGTISPRTIDLSPEQLIFIKAGHGTGKTKTSRALVQALSQKSPARILSINANRALTQEIAESFGLDHYQNVHPDDAAMVNRMATTIHSLIKPQVTPVYRDPEGKIKKMDVLILDEITQILAAFASGQIRQPDSVLYALLDLIEKTIEGGGLVLCMDADLSSADIRQFREWYPHLTDRMEVYEKPFEERGIRVRFGTGIKARNAVISDMLDRVGLGEVITVAADSKNLVNDIKAQIEQRFPDKACLAIHADNSSRPEEKAFLQNPNEEAKKYSVILYSPAIVGGLSVTSVKPNHCYVFSYNKLDAPAVMQQMFRFRKTTDFTVVADLMPPTKDCEDFIQRIHCLEHMEQFDHPGSGYAGDYVGFVERIRADKARLLSLGANALWDYLEQRKLTVTPLSDSLCLNSDYSNTADDLKAIRQQHRDELPKKLVQAKCLTEIEFQQLNALPFKTEAEQISCQRYRICGGLGITPSELTEADCNFWLDTGLNSLNYFSAARGFDVIEDDPDNPLCHRKFQSMLQKYLHYLLEPLYQADYVFLDSWSRKEANEVVDRIMAMDEKDQWALQRLKLIPGSMIAGRGCDQKIIRPKNPTDYVNNYLLSKRLGIQHQSYQVRDGKNREWRYSVCCRSLQQMERYSAQRARANGLKQVSRVKGELVKTEAFGRAAGGFSDWYLRRWQGRGGQKAGRIGFDGEDALSGLCLGTRNSCSVDSSPLGSLGWALPMRHG